MSSIERTLKANRAYAESFALGELPGRPKLNLAVVACMDARVSVEKLLGLKEGDAHIIRNAGGLVTDDALRSLIIGTRLLGVKEVMIISHTDCGMTSFNESELVDRLVDETGTDAVSPGAFHAFSDLEENLRRQVSRLAAHPWIDSGVSVRGFVFDVKSGTLREVS